MDFETVELWRTSLVRAGLQHVRTGVYRRRNSPPQFTGDRPGNSCEAVEIAHPFGRKRWNGRGRAAYWEGVQPRGDDQVRAGQKPLAVISTMIEQFTDAGELILDTFAGSGTTGVAAITTGRRFHGFELDPDTARAAAKRMAEAERQLPIMVALSVGPRRRTPTQVDLLPEQSEGGDEGGAPQKTEQHKGDGEVAVEVTD